MPTKLGPRDVFIEQNLGLVHACAGRFKGRGVEYDDLYSAGCMGLVKAYDGFDQERGVQFSTYAVPVILGEIKKLFRDGGTVKVSRSVKELATRVRRAREKLTGSMGREPTIEEIAAAVGASREEVAASMEAGAEVESLYRPVGDEDGICLMDRLEEEENGQEDLLNRMVLEKLLGELKEEEREIILRRYYLGQTQTKIAAQLGISQVQVSRLEKRILKQMRQRL